MRAAAGTAPPGARACQRAPGGGAWARSAEPSGETPQDTAPADLRPPQSSGIANWACSVDPARAIVSAPGAIACVTRSKYPVPASRWCLVAV